MTPHHFFPQKVKEWLQHIGLGDHAAVVHDEDDPDDGAMLMYNEHNVKSR